MTDELGTLGGMGVEKVEVQVELVVLPVEDLLQCTVYVGAKLWGHGEC